MKNPMSNPEPWTLVAEGYVAETQPAFEQYCRAALTVAQFRDAEKALDVACGPGTLSLLIQKQAREIHSIDFSSGMLECFNREIIRSGIRNITTYRMDGQNLEFAEGTFDWAFSIFGLMFFPDRDRGFREIARVLRPGGRAVITSWAPVADSTAMQLMLGAIQAASLGAQGGNEIKAFTLEDPDNFRREMEQAGFVDVSITPFNGSWPVTDIEAFLDSMVRGSAPITLMKSQLDEGEWKQKRGIMLRHLQDKLHSLPTVLHSKSWIGVGSKPGMIL